MAVHRRCRIHGVAEAALLSAEALDASWIAAKAVNRHENSMSTDQQAPTSGRPSVRTSLHSVEVVLSKCVVSIATHARSPT